MSNHKILNQVHVEVRRNAIHCKNDTIKRSNISRIWKGSYEKHYFIPNLLLVLLILVFFIHGRLLFAAILLLGTILTFINHEISLFRTKGIHLQLNSGFVYTFPADSREFATQVLTTLKTFLDGEEQEYLYQIDFRDNTIIQDVLLTPKLISTAVEVPAPVPAPEPEPAVPAADESAPTSAPEENAASSLPETVVSPLTESAVSPLTESAVSPLAETAELFHVPAAAALPHTDMDPVSEELERLFQYYKESAEPDSAILLLIKEAQLAQQQKNLERLTELYQQFIQKEILLSCNSMGLFNTILQVRQLIYK